MSKRIDWLYDPAAHRKNKTETERMNEAVDLAAVAAEPESAETRLDRVSSDMMQKIKEDPLFAIKRTQMRKRSRSPRTTDERQKRLRDILFKTKR